MGNFQELRINTGGTEEEQHPTLNNPSTGTPGKLSWTAEGGLRDMGVQGVNTSNLTNGLQGILQTAKTPSGSPTGEIKDDTMVTYQGITMRADIAAKCGYITKG